MAELAHPNQRRQLELPPALRRTTVPPGVREWVHRSLGAPVARVRRLPGASSTAVHRLQLADGRAVVLRRYSWRGFLDDEPEAPRRELDVLRFARANGLLVPSVLAADPEGTQTGDSVPVIVMALLPGRPLACPDPRLLAEAAAAIHAVDATRLGHNYFPWYESETTTPPALTQQPRLWERAIEILRNGVPRYRPVLIHRDFHPGNVLWCRGRMSGVVDWANGCRGPAGCDVATCRSNLVTWAGPATASAFVDAYEAVTGQQLHPYWMLANLLEAGAAHWTADNLARGEPELGRLVSLLW